MMFNEPKVVFWPVGTGDSTSIVVAEDVVLQVDLRYLSSADDADDDHAAMIDELVDKLPNVGGRPYLSAFALTHPDKDHIQGFAELHKKVSIGEIWFTPRVFIEDDEDLCKDAVAFKNEAKRRVKKTIASGGDTQPGDRIRLIGYDGLLTEDEFAGFPEDRLTLPGSSITQIDGMDYHGKFNAFIHAPFADGDEADRNDTSLCMQVLLGSDPSKGGVLLLGDIAYPTLHKIFDRTKKAGNDRYLKWKVLLAPHHCSKSAMYQTEGDSEELKQDILNDLEHYQVDGGVIVASSEKIPSHNEPGDNPPHTKAKNCYQEIADGGFLCTHEDGESAEPIVFTVEDGTLLAPDLADTGSAMVTSKLASDVIEGRGTYNPPSEEVSYGC